jgi:peptide chain release factor
MAVNRVLQTMANEANQAVVGIDVIESGETDGLGPSSAIVVLTGDEADGFAAGWVGTIKWVSQSTLRPGHKRRNWFVGVTQLPTNQVAASLDARDIKFETLRAGGPGGQHQNTTDSAVRALHVPSGISVVAREHRSQHRNKAAAITRLAEILEAKARQETSHAQHAEWTARIEIQRGNALRTI